MIAHSGPASSRALPWRHTAGGDVVDEVWLYHPRSCSAVRDSGCQPPAMSMCSPTSCAPPHTRCQHGERRGKQRECLDNMWLELVPSSHGPAFHSVPVKPSPEQRFPPHRDTSDPLSVSHCEAIRALYRAMCIMMERTALGHDAKAMLARLPLPATGRSRKRKSPDQHREP